MTKTDSPHRGLMTNRYRIRRVCAWCGKVLGHTTSEAHDTHGICVTCAEREFGPELAYRLVDTRPTPTEVPA